MNNFLNNLRAKYYQFMQGRYGTDQLNFVLLWGAIIVMVIGSVTGMNLLVMASDALLILTVFRMLSKNRTARAAENSKYLTKTYALRKALSEFMARWRNRKQYKYFTCPKCRERYRVPRGKGKVTITCRKCGEKFDGKA